jgi:hypothetical protein
MDMYSYYRAWYIKWVNVFRRLLDLPSTYRVRELREKVKYFFWKLELRMLCYKWYEDKAEQSKMYPKSLK